MLKNINDFLTKIIEKKCGFNQYLNIIVIKEKNNLIDEDYKKNFVSYYKIRRNEEWLTQYFDYMLKNKSNQNITFSEILDKISRFKRKVAESKKHPDGFSNETIEASFASKMLNTLQPDKYPILDKNVLKTFGLKIGDSEDFKDGIEIAKNTYNKLCEKFDSLISNKDFFVPYEKAFDTKFPDYKKISKIKKLDFYLWCLGEEGKFIDDCGEIF